MSRNDLQHYLPHLIHFVDYEHFTHVIEGRSSDLVEVPSEDEDLQKSFVRMTVDEDDEQNNMVQNVVGGHFKICILL